MTTRIRKVTLAIALALGVTAAAVAARQAAQPRTAFLGTIQVTPADEAPAPSRPQAEVDDQQRGRSGTAYLGTIYVQPSRDQAQLAATMAKGHRRDPAAVAALRYIGELVFARSGG